MASIVEEQRSADFEEEIHVDDKAARAAQKLLDEGWMNIIDKSTGKRMEFNPFTGEMREFLTTEEKAIRDQNVKAEKKAEVSSSDEEDGELNAELTDLEVEEEALSTNPKHVFETLDFMTISTQYERKEGPNLSHSNRKIGAHHNMQPIPTGPRLSIDGATTHNDGDTSEILEGDESRSKGLNSGSPKKESKESISLIFEEIEEKKQSNEKTQPNTDGASTERHGMLKLSENEKIASNFKTGSEKAEIPYDQTNESSISQTNHEPRHDISDPQTTGRNTELQHDEFFDIDIDDDIFSNEIDHDDLNLVDSDESMLFESSESSDADTSGTSEYDWNDYEDSD